jgi:cytoplasmic iron level regulating protein YaaA (DUF328/UPF0246 family)
MKKKTLIIFACCNRKKSGGAESLHWRRSNSVISRLPLEVGERLLESRFKLSQRFKYQKGKDLGGDQDVSKSLMRAFERYDGNLYRRIERTYWHQLAKVDHVEILIVSALYGLLTPFEPIRTYNLVMTKAISSRLSLARWWRNEGLGIHLREYIINNDIKEVHDFLSGSYSSIAHPIYSLKSQITIKNYLDRYRGLGSGADYHRGTDINKLLNSLLK